MTSLQPPPARRALEVMTVSEMPPLDNLLHAYGELLTRCQTAEEQVSGLTALVLDVTAERDAAQARIASLERQLLATAEGQRATLDQLIRVTGERESLRVALDATTESSDRLLVERDSFMNRLGLLLPTLSDEQTALLAAASIESQSSERLCSLYQCPNAAEPDDDWCSSCRAGVLAASIESQGDEGRHQQPERAGDGE